MYPKSQLNDDLNLLTDETFALIKCKLDNYHTQIDFREKIRKVGHMNNSFEQSPQYQTW